MSKGKVLITEPVHELLLNGLAKIGYEVIYHPEISRSEALQIIEDYSGLVINSKVFADKFLLEKAKNLRFIARCGSGKEVIDFDYCQMRNIAAITSPEGNRQAVAEHALGMLLSMMNNIHIAHQQVMKKQWLREQNRGVELSGKTIGIIGFGNTGEAFANVLSGFQLTILAYDKYRKGYESKLVKEVAIEEIFDLADVVSLHLPLSHETIHFANDIFFHSFKKRIWFVNTSRGSCVNTIDLLHAIKGNKVVGAALDVLENEKLETFSPMENELFEQLKNTGKVLFTPHVAGWTHESKRKIAEVLLQKIELLAH